MNKLDYIFISACTFEIAAMLQWQVNGENTFFMSLPPIVAGLCIAFKFNQPTDESR